MATKKASKRRTATIKKDTAVQFSLDERSMHRLNRYKTAMKDTGLDLGNGPAVKHLFHIALGNWEKANKQLDIGAVIGAKKTG
jgi:hypothetical protein